MKIWKFFGVSPRQALRQVKEALGPDAVILSNRSVDGGVEMAAVASGDVATIANQAAPAQTPASIAVTQAATSGSPAAAVSEGKTEIAAPPETRNDAAATARLSVRRRPRVLGTWSAASRNVRKPAIAPRAGSSTDPDNSNEESARRAQVLTENVLREIQALRGVVEHQIASAHGGEIKPVDPLRAAAFRRLLGAGFSAALARKILAEVPFGENDEAIALRVHQSLASKLITAPADDDIVISGGVYALVGPTGVGKTTTIAKIAARCVVRHGADKVALLTTDSYRIGAHEQLRIYGRILGVPVHAVRDAADLRTTLAELASRHIVLIDTMGMSQRDQRVAEQTTLLCGAGSAIRTLLLLNATCNGETLTDVVRAYGHDALADCIITKSDEAASLGAALDVTIRKKLTIHYVANGQRVPEDLSPARIDALLDQALGADARTAMRVADEDELLPSLRTTAPAEAAAGAA